HGKKFPARPRKHQLRCFAFQNFQIHRAGETSVSRGILQPVQPYPVVRGQWRNQRSQSELPGHGGDPGTKRDHQFHARSAQYPDGAEAALLRKMFLTYARVLACWPAKMTISIAMGLCSRED